MIRLSSSHTYTNLICPPKHYSSYILTLVRILEVLGPLLRLVSVSLSVRQSVRWTATSFWECGKLDFNSAGNIPYAVPVRTYVRAIYGGGFDRPPTLPAAIYFCFRPRHGARSYFEADCVMGERWIYFSHYTLINEFYETKPFHNFHIFNTI